jgi:tetratricopeptide (TPR) repeat protein
MDKAMDKLIDKYVKGIATPDEVEQVKQLMQDDPDMAKEVSFRQNLKAVASKADEEQFLSVLQGIEKNNKVSHSRGYLYWIASVAAILIIGFIAFNFWPNKNTNDLFATHYEPYRNVVKPVTRGETKMDSLSQAFFYYENKNYDKAISYFNALKERPESQVLEFYRAMIYIEQEEFDKAYQTLELYAAPVEAKLNAQSLWYMALLNIRKDNTEKAKIQLQQLIDLGNFKISTARAILQEL